MTPARRVVREATARQSKAESHRFCANTSASWGQFVVAWPAASMEPPVAVTPFTVSQDLNEAR